ncbi:MAG TPA: ATP-binding cassette domain-containing protein, partial [Candidatus Methylomirabilis sp.]|nr:ATP-binding cassette domain-containing protein [Candidatus Methylomirabilis sp.]
MPATAGRNGRLLEVKNLHVHFYTGSGVVKAVDGVSYGLKAGQTLGLVGESGSGKTVSSLVLLRLIPRPGKIISGAIRFQDADLLTKSEDEMIAVRGKQIAMIFQNPAYSLNPIYSIGTQLGEIL